MAGHRTACVPARISQVSQIGPEQISPASRIKGIRGEQISRKTVSRERGPRNYRYFTKNRTLGRQVREISEMGGQKMGSNMRPRYMRFRDIHDRDISGLHCIYIYIYVYVCVWTRYYHARLHLRLILGVYSPLMWVTTWHWRRWRLKQKIIDTTFCWATVNCHTYHRHLYDCCQVTRDFIDSR